MNSQTIKTLSALAIVGVMALGAACTPKPTAEEVAAADAASASASSSSSSAMTAAASEAASSAVSNMADVSSLLGKWTGVEGTSLNITQVGSTYAVTITNLDGPRNFTGAAVQGGISFERDGTVFLIHHGTGAQTGMKWLADKQDCVVVAPNEGYCRG
jgi:hypothetical protein